MTERLVFPIRTGSDFFHLYLPLGFLHKKISLNQLKIGSIMGN